MVTNIGANLTLSTTPTSSGLTSTAGNTNTGGLLNPNSSSSFQTQNSSSIGSNLNLSPSTSSASGLNQNGQSIMAQTPVNPSPVSNQIANSNPITLPNSSLNATKTNNSLVATSNAAMSTPPTPPPSYDPMTGFLTTAGKAAGMKPIQPNDPSGGNNTTSLINNYLGGNNTTSNTNPSNIDNNNLIPDTSGNANNANLAQFQGLNAQLGTETQTRNDLNTQFGVDQKQQNYIDAFNQYQSKSVQYQQQQEAIMNDPTKTREQATADVAEISRENNADLANLAVVTQAAQGNYTTALDIVQRKMDAQFQPVQAQIDNLKSIVESPNSNLTASQSAQINANMFALQNNLTNTKNALGTGSQTLIQNGLYTADIGKQLDAAQTPEQVNAIVSQAMTGAGLADPNATSSGAGGISSVSPQYQSYVAQTSGGASYVPQTKLQNLTTFQQQEAARQLAAAGIPVLDADQTLKIQNIDVTQQNLAGLQDVINGKDVTTGAQGTPLLGSGVLGRVGSSISNAIGSATQSNPNLAAFNNYRLTAINTLQSLGAGSGGSRITASEIATAVSNLPTLTDNMQTAQAKLSIVNGFLTKWTNELLPNQSSSSSDSGSGGLYDF